MFNGFSLLIGAPTSSGGLFFLVNGLLIVVDLLLYFVCLDFDLAEVGFFFDLIQLLDCFCLQGVDWVVFCSFVE